MTKKKTVEYFNEDNEVNEKIKKQIDKIYTDLVILAEVLAKDDTTSFTINLHYAKIKFLFGKEMKDE